MRHAPPVKPSRRSVSGPTRSSPTSSERARHPRVDADVVAPATTSDSTRGSGLDERDGDVAAACRVSRSRICTSIGTGANPPASRASPWTNAWTPAASPWARTRRPGRARRRHPGCSSASSMRLSHWLRICGWIFEGRCDERSSHRPYLRPSAATWMSRSQQQLRHRAPGSVPHRLWASSMTSSVGTRRSRCDHSSSTTSRRWRRVRRVAEPAEVHHGDAVATGDDVRGGRQVARPHLPVEHPEVLHPLGQGQLTGCAGAQRSEHVGHLHVRADLRQEADEGVVLVLVAHRVQLQRRGLGLAGHRCGTASAAVRRPPCASELFGAPARRGRRSAGRRPPTPPGPSSRGGQVSVRVEHGHPQVGLQQEPLESTPSAYVLPDPLWPQRKVCRLNPPARRLASAPTSPVRQVPIVRVPAAAPCRPPSSVARRGPWRPRGTAAGRRAAPRLPRPGCR